eukprot:SAG11_NODE_3712_length_2266_cov_16.035072_1_plen_48_part_00
MTANGLGEPSPAKPFRLVEQSATGRNVLVKLTGKQYRKTVLLLQKQG